MSSTATTLDTAPVAARRSLLGKTGVGIALFFRYFYGLFFAFSAYSKWSTGVPWSDRLQRTFQERLAEIEPDTVMNAMGHWFLENIGIPYYLPIAWYITLSVTAVAIGLLLGLATRAALLLGAFVCVCIGVGGYYDASLIPLTLLPLILALFPTGHWFGLDRRLHRKHPDSIWFR